MKTKYLTLVAVSIGNYVIYHDNHTAFDHYFCVPLRRHSSLVQLRLRRHSYNAIVAEFADIAHTTLSQSDK